MYALQMLSHGWVVFSQSAKIFDRHCKKKETSFPFSEGPVFYNIQIRVKENGQEQRLMADWREIELFCWWPKNAYWDVPYNVPPASLYIVLMGCRLCIPPAVDGLRKDTHYTFICKSLRFFFSFYPFWDYKRIFIFSNFVGVRDLQVTLAK